MGLASRIEVPEAAVLRRCSLFASLGADAMRALSTEARRVSWPRRMTHELGAALAVIDTGRVRILDQRRGTELTLSYRSDGQVIGERCWIEEGGVRFAALTETEAVVISARVLGRLVSEQPTVGLALAAHFAGESRRLESRLGDLLALPVEARVIRFLLDRAGETGTPEPTSSIGLPHTYTHREIAGFVGSTRETVTLVLGELKRAGLIDVERRRIRIVDLPALRARLG